MLDNYNETSCAKNERDIIDVSLKEISFNPFIIISTFKQNIIDILGIRLTLP